MSTRREQKRIFYRKYVQLGKEGYCDSVEASEYERVKNEWFNLYHGDLSMEDFIKIRASIPFAHPEFAHRPEASADYFKN